MGGDDRSHDLSFFSHLPKQKHSNLSYGDLGVGGSGDIRSNVLCVSISMWTFPYISLSTKYLLAFDLLNLELSNFIPMAIHISMSIISIYRLLNYILFALL